MSHVIARTAANKALLRFLKSSSCIAGLCSIVSCDTVFAQEKPFRMTSIRLPAILVVPTPILKQDAEKISDPPKSGQTLENRIIFKPELTQSRGAANGTDAAKGTDANQVAAKETSMDPPIDDENDQKSKSDQAKTKTFDPMSALGIPNIPILMGKIPVDKAAGRLPVGSERYGVWGLDNKTWTPPVFCHQPLYFEDTMLERHGHERLPCIQPILSGARFFYSIAFLPYQAYLQPPLQERYNTGNYRPGSAVPALRQRAPYDAGAMRFQLLTTGTAVLAVQP